MPLRDLPQAMKIAQRFLQLPFQTDVSREYKLMVDSLRERGRLGDIQDLTGMLGQSLLPDGRVVFPAGTRIPSFQGNKMLLNLFFLALEKSDPLAKTQPAEYPRPVGVKTQSLLYSTSYRNTGYSGDVVCSLSVTDKISYVIVGDVAGHGVEAAGFAYVARQVAEQLVATNPDLSPHEVVELLYDVLEKIGWKIADLGMSSFGVIRTDTSSGTVACAGGPQTPICIELKSGAIQQTAAYSPDSYALAKLRNVAVTIPEYSFSIRDVKSLTVLSDGMVTRSKLDELHKKLRDELRGVESFYSMIHEALAGSTEDDATFIGLAFGG
jgi:hypothetical protein